MRKLGFRDYVAFTWRYNGRHAWQIAAGVLLAMVTNVCGLATPFLTRYLIDDVIGQGNAHLFGRVLLIAIGVIVVLFATAMSANIVLFNVFRYSGVRLRGDLFCRVQGASLSFFTRNNAGELNYRIMTDSRALVDSWSDYLVTIPYQSILFVSAVFMYRWDARLAYFVFFLVALQAAPIWRFREPLKQLNLKRKQLEQQVGGFVTDRVGNIRLIRALATEAREAKSLRERLIALVKVAFSEYVMTHLSGILASVISNLWMFGILWYGGRQVISGTMTLGTLMAFMLFANMLYQPVAQIMRMALSFQGVLASLERVREPLDLESVVEDLPEDLDVELPNGQVSLRGVSFRYHDRSILDDVNLDIEHGSIVTLVGPSGVGKTTLALLLTRMMSGAEGTLEVGGFPIDAVRYTAFRRSVQFLGQENYVMNGTLWENLTMGCGDVKEAEVDAALRRLNMDYIQDLPDGLQTRIGAGGLAVSGGEAQRIGLVRTFLKRPKLLVLDEPTAFIDPQTESGIHQAIREISRDCTVLVVSHRTAAMRLADKVVMLQGGKIIGEGSFADMHDVPQFCELINSVDRRGEGT